MWTLLMTVAFSAPTLAADIPAETDLALRLELGVLSPELKAMWGDVGELLEAWPPVKGLADTVLKAWLENFELLEEKTGANLAAPGAVATAVLDIDAKGAAVYAVVVRGALTGASAVKKRAQKRREAKAKAAAPAAPEATTTTEQPAVASPDLGAAPVSPQVVELTVDGIPAFRLAERDVAWCILDGKTLVLGTVRGMQRQVRHLRAATSKLDAEVQKLALQMRKPAPVMIAFVLPRDLRAFAGEALPNVGPLVGAMHSGSITARGTQVDLRLQADDEQGRDALEHGSRALVALLRASTAMLEGGAEALLGLDLLGRRPEALPKQLETAKVKGFVADWLHGATFEAVVRHRRGNVVDTRLSVSGHRALVAALAVLALGAAPSGNSAGRAEAQVMLMALRHAQLAYKEEKGEFLTCGPVPAEMPVGRAAWPKQSCFDSIGYRPPGKVQFQVAAAVEEDTLIMMARGDVDGDGVPEVWLLDETSTAVERFKPPTGGDG